MYGSTYESAYKSLLQGVSQQDPTERQDGQVSAQVNMLSDPVTNLRRRPGAKFETAFEWSNIHQDYVLGLFTDLAGARVHVLVNTLTGNVRVFNEELVQEANLNVGAYLVGEPRDIRTAVVGNSLFFANVKKTPVITHGSGGVDPNNAGFFYVVSGAFSKEYNVSITHSGGTTTVKYTTPSGSGAGDAALATPEHIASDLTTQLLAAGLAVWRDGPYVYLSRAGGVSVNTNVGTAYLVVSKANVVNQIGELPARLPAAADGFVCRVGTGKLPQYYKYVHAQTAWHEAGQWGGPAHITNVPISLIWTGDAWAFDQAAYEGRLAGDDETNPTHLWIDEGITGISSYQGRLVILSGATVSLSASTEPRRFYRSTVSSLLASDPIEVGSNMHSAASYEWALPFQKDLVLFSTTHQAVLPSNGQAITPMTATVVPTSTYEVDTLCSPVQCGRTVMYSSPKSTDFFRMMDMVPSQYTEGQYLSLDATPHLPTYFAGRCRFLVASGVSDMVVVAPSGDSNSLIVHEYYWEGDQKVQRAWHQWLFPYHVSTAYFASDKVFLVFVQNGNLLFASVDPRGGAVNTEGMRRPFLDLYIHAVPNQYNQVYVPQAIRKFEPLHITHCLAIAASGDLSGERIGGVILDSATYEPDASYKGVPVAYGVPYYSGVLVGAPVIRDQQGSIVHSGKATVQRFRVGVRDTGYFDGATSDAHTPVDELGLPTISFSDPELNLGAPIKTHEAMVDIPCRTDLRSTVLELSTSSTSELNITSVEYVAKHHQKIRRR